jgi:hypothetical protein
MLRAALTLALFCLVGGAAAAEWHHPLYLGDGDYWRSRVRVVVRNGMGRDAAGAPVSVKVGSGAGEARMVGAAAESVRVVNSAGEEMLFAIQGPGGDLIKRGPIPEGSELVIPAECAAGGTASYFAYFDNPSAWQVPDFLEASYSVRNGSVEHGSGDTPNGWVHDGREARHEATWTDEDAHSGRRCLKTAVAHGAEPMWISTRQHGISIIGGAEYTMRAWVKARGVDGEAGWYIHVGDGADPMLFNQVISGGGGSYDWKEIRLDFTAPAEANRASLGTVLWGSGEAWFDDVTLECASPAVLTAVAMEQERMSLAEIGADAAWYDDDPEDEVQWDVRAPLILVNVSSQDARALASADISPLLARLRDMNGGSMRVTDGTEVVPHRRLGNTLLFEADAPARSARTYFVNFSRDERIAPVPASDYAGLTSSSANLGRNPSFEEGDRTPEGWQGEAPPGITMRLDGRGMFGERCARIDVPDEAEMVWVGRRQDIPVRPGHTYLYAAWVKCENVHDGDVRLHAHYRDAAGELCRSMQYATAGPSIGGTTDWTLMSGVFRMPEECATFQLHLTMLARGTVWHDGVLFAEVLPGALGKLESLADVAASGPIVWPVNGLVKVFQDDPPPAEPGPARITTARNEQEPLQLAIRSPRALAGVRVEIDPPVGPDGARLEDVAVAVVGYVPIDNPSGYYNSDSPGYYRKYPPGSGGSDGWAGMWPDPLLPTNVFDLQANTTQPVWVTVSVPKEAPAGDYAGAVRFSSGGVKVAEIPFTVRVWDFTLPDENPLAAVYDIRFGSTWGEPDKPRDQVRAEIRELMAANRLCPDIVYPGPVISYENGTVKADFSAFDAAAARYLDELKLPHTYTPWDFYLFGWGHPPGEKWGEAPYEGEYPYDEADPGKLRPEYKAAYQACLRVYWEHMKEKGWADRVVLYLSDEPHYQSPRIVEQMKALCEMVHEVDPEIPVYVSTWQHVPEWDGYVDVWGIGHYGTVSRETMAQLRAAGDRLYFTTDGHMCTDTPYLAIERLLPHYCFHWDVEAYEFWGVSWFTYNPYEFGWPAYIRQSAAPGSTTWIRYPNGDGFLIYPGGPIGHEGLVSSIRLEQAREGVEDYLYLDALRECGDSAEARGALALARTLVRMPSAGGRYSAQILPDPDTVLQVKEAVARAIEGMQPTREAGR